MEWGEEWRLEMIFVLLLTTANFSRLQQPLGESEVEIYSSFTTSFFLKKGKGLNIEKNKKVPDRETRQAEGRKMKLVKKIQLPSWATETKRKGGVEYRDFISVFYTALPSSRRIELPFFLVRKWEEAGGKPCLHLSGRNTSGVLRISVDGEVFISPSDVLSLGVKGIEQIINVNLPAVLKWAWEEKFRQEVILWSCQKLSGGVLNFSEEDREFLTLETLFSFASYLFAFEKSKETLPDFTGKSLKEAKNLLSDSWDKMRNSRAATIAVREDKKTSQEEEKEAFQLLSEAGLI